MKNNDIVKRVFFLEINYFCKIILPNLLGPKHRQRFLCEVRVEGITYAGVGNSTTKKEAQANASRDFVNYLVRSGQVPSNEVPNEVRVKAEGQNEGAQDQGNGDQQQQRSVFQVLPRSITITFCAKAVVSIPLCETDHNHIFYMEFSIRKSNQTFLIGLLSKYTCLHALSLINNLDQSKKCFLY